MDKKDNNRFNELKLRAAMFLKNKGIYFVMIACLAMVGVAAALMFTDRNQQSAENPMPSDDGAAVGQNQDESLDELRSQRPIITLAPIETVSPTVTPTPLPDFSPSGQPSTTPKPQADKLQAPCSGAIIWDYAMTELIYSVTLNHWTTHPGVDIEAQQGTEVKAVMGGTVKLVYTDDALGVCVVVEHDNNVTTMYANLKEEPPVKSGDKINKGTVIGLVGNTSVSECGINSHLHFEYLVESEPKNPKDYVLFEQ